MSIVITGSAEAIRDLLFGPPQHNEHCRGYRWHQYCADDSKRWASVEAALKKMHAERRERLTSQQRADELLREYQSQREAAQ